LRHTNESARAVLAEKAPGAIALEPYPGTVAGDWKVRCPMGHVTTTTLAKVHSAYSVSCPRCARHGFDPSKPGWVYFLTAERQGSAVFQVGITNVLRQRLAKHRRSGFTPVSEEPLLLFSNGTAAADLERAILQGLRERGALSLAALWGPGAKFDGYTESFLSSTAAASSLTELLAFLDLGEAAATGEWREAPRLGT